MSRIENTGKKRKKRHCTDVYVACIEIAILRNSYSQQFKQHSNSIPHIHNTNVKIYEKEIPFEKDDGKKARTHSHGIRRRGIHDEKLLFNIFNLFYSTVLFFLPLSHSHQIQFISNDSILNNKCVVEYIELVCRHCLSIQYNPA